MLATLPVISFKVNMAYYVLDNIEHMNLNWINIYFSPQTVGVIVRLEKENFQILSMHNKVQ